jgi:hypothetical protein
MPQIPWLPASARFAMLKGRPWPCWTEAETDAYLDRINRRERLGAYAPQGGK